MTVSRPLNSTHRKGNSMTTSEFGQVEEIQGVQSGSTEDVEPGFVTAFHKPESALIDTIYCLESYLDIVKSRAQAPAELLLAMIAAIRSSFLKMLVWHVDEIEALIKTLPTDKEDPAAERESPANKTTRVLGEFRHAMAEVERLWLSAEETIRGHGDASEAVELAAKETERVLGRSRAFVVAMHGLISSRLPSPLQSFVTDYIVTGIGLVLLLVVIIGTIASIVGVTTLGFGKLIVVAAAIGAGNCLLLFVMAPPEDPRNLIFRGLRVYDRQCLPRNNQPGGRHTRTVELRQNHGRSQRNRGVYRWDFHPIRLSMAIR